ncbi:RNA-binding domain-containing protein, X-linked 2 [[Emmonsia] crescens]|uniref:RNA-binding domain-containing protein, X-linked 2 n=1 Tax=[Emmonsia] crescens TaxID=73230 RepID=A0A2B7ZPD6_9EURO|nr:RNA-binding domain-containing protein, X-linked 2 [Emmonsia crescens]
MNAIRQVQALNKKELENVVPPEASWHADYRDTAYIYIGSLPYDISEGDVLTIFSQYGEPVHLNLVRDKETGKSKGFAFLKYEDQRSTDLAVDNLGGATILGRMIRVDHVRYKRKEEEGLEDNVATLAVGETGGGKPRNDNGEEGSRRIATKHGESDTDTEDRRIKQRPLLKEEKELQKLIEEHDEEDPMKEYLIQEKREQVARALERSSTRKKHRSDSSEKEDKHGHRHRHHRHHHRRHRDDRSYSPDRGRQFPRREISRSRSPSQSRERKRHRDRRDRG